MSFKRGYATLMGDYSSEIQGSVDNAAVGGGVFWEGASWLQQGGCKSSTTNQKSRLILHKKSYDAERSSWTSEGEHLQC
jgi:hypothetical protein